jgi:DENN (AEX-3) domain/ENTH domain
MFQNLALEERLLPHKKGAEQWFLDKLFDQHRHMCVVFASLPQQDRKPMVLTVDSLEAGLKQIPLIELADNSKFLIPTSLLAPTSPMESVTASSILPLLRVLGVQNTLRLLSALLSESRILLVSCSPTRLAQCARSALSILAQGLLNWQHLYIPVLPPHLFQYLAAPVPYLIGMLSTLVPRLDQSRAEGLGEMVIINLDTVQMETRGINPMDVARRIPDLFRSTTAEQGGSVNSMSASEMLGQDLIDLLKVDKRALHGESALTNVSVTAAKASKAVKAGFSMLKEQGKKFLKNRSSSNVSNGSGSDDEQDMGGGEGGGPDQTSPQVTVLPDFIYTQGAQNEFAEEEARIAFSSFFLSLFGNMRWYLSATPGQLPQLDRQRFLQQKRAMGEGEHTPVWPMLENFCNTQMLEEFAKDRVEEVRTRQPVTSDSPLFIQCSNYHRLHNVDFNVINIRRVARQVAQNMPSRTVLQTQARRTTMLLTSNKTFDGDYNQAVAQLVEECRESSSVLFDVMSVIWVRLRDSKGLHWKHGYQALQILRNLLYHGPLAAVAEATDGLDKIRVMKFYNDNMRSQICTQIRQVANQVYNLLVDRAKLFAIRRRCIDKRRLLQRHDNSMVRPIR